MMLIQEDGIPAPVVQAALEKQAKGRENRSAATRFIRVDAEKLEELMTQEQTDAPTMGGMNMK